MTVVAYRDGVMAADGRISDSKSGEIVTDNFQKLYRYDKYIIGCAGVADAIPMYIDSLRAGANITRIKGVFAMRFSEKDGLEVMEGGPFIKLAIPYYAIGCGGPLAVVAMDLGATAAEAVRATNKRNVFCGGRVRTISI